MGMAWVSWSPERRAFEVQTGSNRYYELFLSTRPELMEPEFAARRGPDNFYSSRAAQGLLPSAGGRALFPLPQHLAERFRDGSLYYMVKTFGDETGKGPVYSPVLGDRDGHAVLSDVDPAGGTPMETVRDREDMAARVNGSRRAEAAGHRWRPAANGRAAPLSAPNGPSGSGVALALALTCREVQRVSVEDPEVPGEPELRSVVNVVASALDWVPDPAGRARSAAAAMNGMIGRRAPYGGRVELARQILRASRQLGARGAGTPRSREQFLPALAGLVPILTQVLPAVLPMVLPLLQKLLGGLAGAKSLTAPADGGAVVNQILQLLAAAGGQPGAAATPPTAAPAGGQPAAGGGQGGTPPPAQDPAAPSVPAPTGPETQPGATPAVSPEQLNSLLGTLQGFRGDGGSLIQAITGHSGSPGTDMLKSVVDRLPIEKMFDGRSWIPTTNYDEWRKTLPWEAVLSLSDPTAPFGALFVPGRRTLTALPGTRLELIDRSVTRLDNGDESWIFLADRPARLQLSVQAGPEGLSRPFLDVRVSCDGTPAGALWRAAFRLHSLGRGERQTVVIELPPDVLARAASDGSPTCISLRVVQQAGEEFQGAELRACCYVVEPHTVVVDGAATLREAPELDSLPGLERQLPRSALAIDVTAVDWRVAVVAGAQPGGFARHLPVEWREAGDEGMLEGGLELFPAAVADLARRRTGSQLGAEDLAALAAAIERSAALRGRMALRVREAVEPRLIAGAEQGLVVRVELGWLPAHLVSFSGASPDGNPTRRSVLPLELPVPRGISVRAG